MARRQRTQICPSPTLPPRRRLLGRPFRQISPLPTARGGGGGAMETLASPSRTLAPLLPRSAPFSPMMTRSPTTRRSSRSDRENAPPADPNIQIDRPASPSVLKKSPSRLRIAVEERMQEASDSSVKVDRSRSVSSFPSVLKKSPSRLRSAVEERMQETSDSSVKVVVRIRPAHAYQRGEELIAKKVSSDSLVVEGRTFNFDSVIGPESTQEEIFQLVGVPLVRNSMAGFNASILSYGESGSGKTYTMWGPLSSMVEEDSVNNCQGIAPRMFHMLFQEIQKKQDSDVEKQVTFQCRCSFLEIHKDQINDLLDPSQRNLQIKDDAKNGFYIENLTEEYVTSVQDVAQILVKGLSSRRVGATSLNSKSSRSHIILTCVIESWSEGTSTKSISSSNISRISLVDLAGSDRNKFDDTDKNYIKEGRQIHKSLSSLGKLVNLLAENHSGDRQTAYGGSCLTYLLKESLGGNAKVAFICTVSPDARCRSGTLSTLRFGQRAKCIENKAVVNEITEDDVNDLSNQIRHLKEELIKERSYQGNPLNATSGYYRGDRARQSLNLLRVSLNRSLVFQHGDSDSEEEVYINEDDVSQLCEQIGNLRSGLRENPDTMLEPDNNIHDSSAKDHPGTDKRSGRDSNSDGGSCLEESNFDEMHIERALQVSTSGNELMENHVVRHHSLSPFNLSIIQSTSHLALDEPTLSVSPKVSNSIKNMRNDPVSPTMNSEDLSAKKVESIRSSLQTKKLSPTDSLAANLQRGLQVLDLHQRNSASTRASLAFSFDHLITKPCERTELVDLDTRTSEDGKPLLTDSIASFICASCRKRDIASNMQIIPFNEGRDSEGSKIQLLENGGESLTDIISRKNELEKICEEQAARISQLNILVEQYKNERDANTIMKQSQGTMLHALPESSKELQHEDCTSVEDGQHKNHTGVPEARVNLQEPLKEKDLENKSTSMIVSSNDSLLQLIRNGTGKSSCPEDREDFEMERQRWTESESRWISLTEELRIDLESQRRLAEKKDNELAMEKKCSAELDDALQRAMLGHAKMIEHYVELQETHSDLVERHKRVMAGVAQVRKAAAKAGAKGAGSAFAEALAAELSALRVQREREIACLKKQNRALRVQLKDTAEAVHAAGELLVRLREAEEAVSEAEGKYERAQQETEKLRKQMEKMKKKHAMEMVTVKHYMAESRLPESALEPLYRSDVAQDTKSAVAEDDQSWRAAFVPSYH